MPAIDSKAINDAPDGSPDTPEAGPSSAVPNLHAQITRVKAAFLMPNNNPVVELKQLDEMIAEASRMKVDVNPLIESTAADLLKNQDVFDNLNFHAALILSGSRFFNMVLRKMGDIVDTDPKKFAEVALPVRIRLVENRRRAYGSKPNDDDAKSLERGAATVESDLRFRLRDQDPLAFAQLAKVRYEQSMHAFDKKDFQKALHIGRKSVEFAQRGNDLYGTLAARGNVAGLFCYHWADTMENSPLRKSLLTKGISVLAQDVTTALQEMEKAQPGSIQRENFNRVVMNNRVHLMQLAKRQGDIDAVRATLQLLRENTVFRKGLAVHEAWATEYATMVDTMLTEAGN